MGITQFNPLLQILFPDAVKILKEKGTGASAQTYDHILLDLNGLLYKLRAREQSDEALILATLKYLDQLLQQFRPKTTLVLALDGPCTHFSGSNSTLPLPPLSNLSFSFSRQTINCKQPKSKCTALSLGIHAPEAGYWKNKFSNKPHPFLGSLPPFQPNHTLS